MIFFQPCIRPVNPRWFPSIHMKQLGWLNETEITFFQLQHYLCGLNHRWFPLTHMEQLGWLNGMGVTFFQLQHYFRRLNPLDRWFLFDSQAGVELVHTLMVWRSSSAKQSWARIHACESYCVVSFVANWSDE